MSSTTTSTSHPVLSASHLSQKHRGDWRAPIYRFFDALSSRPAVVIGVLVLTVIIAGALATYFNHRESVSKQANNALFHAQKTLESELRAYTTSVIPASAPEAKPAQGKGSEAAQAAAQAAQLAKKAAEADAEKLLFAKIDVDAKFPQAVKKLGAVAQEFSGTRAGFEAMLALGSLYMNHGQGAKALSWYERALQSSPKALDRKLAMMSLGSAQESTGKHAEAVQSFEKAMTLGMPALKGELLLAVARNQELMKDSAKARSSYDRIISELPNSEQARTAEVLKSQIQ